MSRFASGELFCAIFFWQPAAKARATRQERKLSQRDRFPPITRMIAFPARKQNTRSQKANGCFEDSLVKVLVSDHGRAEEAQHLSDRVRDRRRAAAGKEQADRARIRGHIFNHE